MENKVYQEAKSKDDSQDSMMVIQPLMRAASEDDEESGGLSSLDDDTTVESSIGSNTSLIYGVEDVPPWHVSFFLGFQHYLTMFCGTISVPFILTPALCIEDNDPARSHIVSTIIFVSGMVTFLQSTFGVRLPIIQGGTFAFLIPTFAILSMPEWKCPAKDVIANMTYEDKTELWQQRMREVQGATIIASFFQMFIGFFGIIGLIIRLITPLTIAPAITMVGLSLFGVAGNMAGKNWGISSL